MNENRDKVIVRTSLIGIVVNILLSAMKLFAGLLTNSIAITLDAVNNISDAASSVITIVGTKLASKEPDKKHPFGYGRVEYFSALIISIIVLYAGISALEESIKSILHPEEPSYTTVSLVIVAVGVAAKILLGRYFVRIGKEVDSASLTGSGEEATLDSIISFSTLAAAAIYMLAHISLESYLAAIISLVIIKSGVEMLRDTISRLLGERTDAETAAKIKSTIRSFPGVSGAYDLVLNDYGPDAFQGSVHIEIPDTYTANQVDDLIRTISTEVYLQHHVILTAIGVYSINTTDPFAMEMRKKVSDLVISTEYVTQIHGFYLDKAKKTLRFDLVVSFDAGDRKAVYAEALKKVQENYPDYTITAAMDIDFTAPQNEKGE